MVRPEAVYVQTELCRATPSWQIRGSADFTRNMKESQDEIQERTLNTGGGSKWKGARVIIHSAFIDIVYLRKPLLLPP